MGAAKCGMRSRQTCTWTECRDSFNDLLVMRLLASRRSRAFVGHQNLLFLVPVVMTHVLFNHTLLLFVTKRPLMFNYICIYLLLVLAGSILSLILNIPSRYMMCCILFNRDNHLITHMTILSCSTIFPFLPYIWL